MCSIFCKLMNSKKFIITYFIVSWISILIVAYHYSTPAEQAILHYIGGAK